MNLFFFCLKETLLLLLKTNRYVYFCLVSSFNLNLKRKKRYVDKITCARARHHRKEL